MATDWNRHNDFENRFAGRAREVLAALVAETKEEWTVSGLEPRADEPNHRPIWCVFTRARDGLAINLGSDRWKGRITSSPSTPDNENKSRTSLRDWSVIRYDETGPEMTAAFDKDARLIARDIMRKVIAPYEPMYAKILDILAKRRASRAEGVNTFEELLPYEDESPYSGRHVRNRPGEGLANGREVSLRIGGFEFTVSPYGGGAKVSGNVGTREALELAAFLKALRARTKEEEAA